MCSKVLFVVLTLYFVANFSNSQKDKKFFRKGYQYVESTQSFYKIHKLHKTWFDAKRTCALEGAKLFYPENINEAQIVAAILSETPSFDDAFIGITDLLSKGFYETIDGILIDDVFPNWSPGEPNDAYGIEDCAAIKQDGTFNDIHCLNKKPFICKKTLASLEWNKECNLPDLDYKLNEKLGRCYKFHLKPRNWADAQAVCSYQRSYLAIINSKEEAEFLAVLTENMLKNKDKENYTTGVVLLGFHNRYEDGWETVRGTSIEDSGYTTWAEGQPDGPPGDVDERCGSMLYNGQLNDIRCDKKAFFICEHEVNKPAADVNYRSGDRKRK